MKKINILFILFFLLGITSFIYLSNRQIEIKKNKLLQEKLENELRYNKMNEDLNKKLANSTIQDVICDSNDGNQFHLSKLVSNKPILIYRYTELHCNVCYETELTSIKKNFAEEKQKVAILCSYQVKRYFVIFKRANKIDLPIYMIPLRAFNWILEDYSAPYYFVLYPDLTVSNIYIPDKNFPDLNKQYLERIKKLLSD
jgi:hypothetical protein